MNAEADPMYGDIMNAFWVAVVVVIAMGNGIVWAPYFAEKISDPLTGGMVESPSQEEARLLLRIIRKVESKGMRKAARVLCFVEGCRRPWFPTAFVIGMNNSDEGSWLEKIFATEVFKFNNARNCLAAYQALKRHGIDPRPHHSPGVNMVIISNEHEVRETPERLDVPPSPEPPALKRDKRINLGTE